MPTLRRQTTLTIAAALIIALALLLTWSTANAQEPPETGTRLEPGLNLVGWVAEPTPVSQLFREIPQLESIWAWDAELRDWIVAGRGAPEWLGGLGRVWAGMGLRLVLGGEEPFVWRRSTEPTRGLVKLRTGWNLVAWSGADQTPIDAALKGIGWSLRTVRRWDAATQQWTTWTSPERTAQLIAAGSADQEADDNSEMPAIRRGEALWIEVARAVNWLQPTDILPRLVFPGGASDELQARVREDLEAVLSFYRTQYGIQVAPDFAVYVTKDVDALIQAWKDDGDDVDDARAALTRAQWNPAAGWITGGGLVVKQELWSGDLASSDTQYGTYVLAHEYTHMVQGGLSDRAGGRSTAWLSEGGAEWAAAEFDDLNGVQSLDDRRKSLLRGIRSDIPTLRSTEVFHGGPVYRLGEFAIDRLVGEYGADSWIEFWRRLALTEAGPHQRWQSTPDWQTALSEITGIAVSEFYVNFNAWQREQALKNAALGPAYHGRWIRGRVIDSDRRPVGGAFVEAIPVDGQPNRTEAAADGRFEVIAPESGHYRLQVAVGDDCTGYYGNGGLVDGEENAALIKVSDSDVSDIDIRWSPNVCGRQIRGRIVGPNAEPLADIRITACRTGDGGQCHSSASAVDGSFAVAADDSGEYLVSANLGAGDDDCSTYFRSGVSTTNPNSASPITVADAHASGILIQVPEDLCRLRVAGFLDGIERFLDGYVSVELWVCSMAGNGCRWGRTDRELEDSGPFAVGALTSGVYRMAYVFDGCSVYHGPAGVTPNAAGSTLINVDSRDVRVAYRQIPVDVCAYEIGGALIGADGQPLADTWVSACLEVGGECVSHAGSNTDDDGAFAIIIPVDGAYHVWFDLDGCTVHFRSSGLTATYSERSTVRVEGRSVRLNALQIPAGMCARRISGHFVDSSGTSLPNKWINVHWPGGSYGAWTDADGRFDIRVPSDGTYQFSIQLQQQPECWPRLAGQTLGSPNNPVRVSGAGVTGIVLRLPGTIEELCE